MSPLPLLLLFLVGQPSGPDAAANPPKAQATGQGPSADVRQKPFSAEAVRAVVAERNDEIQSCYETAMARRGMTAKNAPTGMVTMSWIITLEGIPSEVRVKKSEIAEPLVTDCMVQAIRTWSFPKPPARQPIEFPFELKLSSSKAQRSKVE